MKVGEYNIHPAPAADRYHTCDEYTCRHACEHPGCESHILYHDEPYCFKHSPDSGSSFRNYDSRTGGWK